MEHNQPEWATIDPTVISFTDPTGTSFTDPTGASFTDPTGASFTDPTGTSFIEHTGTSSTEPAMTSSASIGPTWTGFTEWSDDANLGLDINFDMNSYPNLQTSQTGMELDPNGVAPGMQAQGMQDSSTQGLPPSSWNQGNPLEELTTSNYPINDLSTPTSHSAGAYNNMLQPSDSMAQNLVEEAQPNVVSNNPGLMDGHQASNFQIPGQYGCFAPSSMNSMNSVNSMASMNQMNQTNYMDQMNPTNFMGSINPVNSMSQGIPQESIMPGANYSFAPINQGNNMAYEQAGFAPNMNPIPDQSNYLTNVPVSQASLDPASQQQISVDPGFQGSICPGSQGPMEQFWQTSGDNWQTSGDNWQTSGDKVTQPQGARYSQDQHATSNQQVQHEPITGNHQERATTHQHQRLTPNHHQPQRMESNQHQHGIGDNPERVTSNQHQCGTGDQYEHATNDQHQRGTGDKSQRASSNRRQRGRGSKSQRTASNRQHRGKGKKPQRNTAQPSLARKAAAPSSNPGVNTNTSGNPRMAVDAPKTQPFEEAHDSMDEDIDEMLSGLNQTDHLTPRQQQIRAKAMKSLPELDLPRRPSRAEAKFGTSETAEMASIEPSDPPEPTPEGIIPGDKTPLPVWMGFLEFDRDPAAYPKITEVVRDANGDVVRGNRGDPLRHILDRAGRPVLPNKLLKADLLNGRNVYYWQGCHPLLRQKDIFDRVQDYSPLEIDKISKVNALANVHNRWRYKHGGLSFVPKSIPENKSSYSKWDLRRIDSLSDEQLRRGIVWRIDPKDPTRMIDDFSKVTFTIPERTCSRRIELIQKRLDYLKKKARQEGLISWEQAKQNEIINNHRFVVARANRAAKKKEKQREASLEVPFAFDDQDGGTVREDEEDTSNERADDSETYESDDVRASVAASEDSGAVKAGPSGSKRAAPDDDDDDEAGPAYTRPAAKRVALTGPSGGPETYEFDDVRASVAAAEDSGAVKAGPSGSKRAAPDDDDDDEAGPAYTRPAAKRVALDGPSGGPSSSPDHQLSFSPGAFERMLSQDIPEGSFPFEDFSQFLDANLEQS